MKTLQWHLVRALFPVSVALFAQAAACGSNVGDGASVQSEGEAQTTGCVPYKNPQLYPCGNNFCGTVSNGCGGELQCACPMGETCGGKTTNYQCEELCIPRVCAANCGVVPNGCGGMLNCGTCGPNEVCKNYSCECVPQPCSASDCGDGCGGTINRARRTISCPSLLR